MITKWLMSPVGFTRGEPHLPYLATVPTVLEYLTELTYCNNGSMVVDKYGNQEIGLGAYGRMGLLIQEAFQLHDLYAFMRGMLMFEPIEEVVQGLVQAELTRCEFEFTSMLRSTGEGTAVPVELLLVERDWVHNANGTWSHSKLSHACSTDEAAQLEGLCDSNLT